MKRGMLPQNLISIVRGLNVRFILLQLFIMEIYGALLALFVWYYAWISNHIHYFMYYVIIHLSNNVYRGVNYFPLKLRQMSNYLP